MLSLLGLNASRAHPYPMWVSAARKEISCKKEIEQQRRRKKNQGSNEGERERGAEQSKLSKATITKAGQRPTSLIQSKLLLIPSHLAGCGWGLLSHLISERKKGGITDYFWLLNILNPVCTELNCSVASSSSSSPTLLVQYVPLGLSESLSHSGGRKRELSKVVK